MREILPLKDQRFVDGGKIRSIVETLRLPDIEQKIYFLRELHTIVRKLPLKIFTEEKDRLQLVSAIQDALDVTIDEEEDELEGELE